MNKLLGVVLFLLLIGAGAYWYWESSSKEVVVVPLVENMQPPMATSTELVVDKTKTILGRSVGGRDITAYHFGEGAKEIVLVGGMHGGYSWNTALLAYEVIEYLKKTPTAIPSGVKVTVIPVVNPDGLQLVVGTTSSFTKASVSTSESTRVSGRFNANRVDLNRNFDCDWKATGTWQSTQVSGGSAAFSEPESQAFRSYIESHKPSAVIAWYSSAGGVFPSQCGAEPSQETLALTSAYAKASGYPAFSDFDFYEVTGDMPNWLSKIGVPAISVLLSSHTDTEFTKNQKGLEALLKRYAQ